MDSTQWPWSLEEEAEWKAELEERDYDFLEELLDDAVADLEPAAPQLSTDDDILEKYSVTA